MTADFSLVLDAQCALAESPVWWAEAGVLVFIDITGRRLHRFDPQSERHELNAVGEDIGCIAPARGGGYVAGMRSGAWLLDARRAAAQAGRQCRDRSHESFQRRPCRPARPLSGRHS